MKKLLPTVLSLLCASVVSAQSFTLAFNGFDPLTGVLDVPGYGNVMVTTEDPAHILSLTGPDVFHERKLLLEPSLRYFFTFTEGPISNPIPVFNTGGEGGVQKDYSFGASYGNVFHAAYFGEADTVGLVAVHFDCQIPEPSTVMLGLLASPLAFRRRRTT